MPRHPKRLLTVPEAADYLGLTEGALRKRMYRREIAFVKAGRTVRFDVRQLDTWIEDHTVEAAS